jgi:hypothetical protein
VAKSQIKPPPGFVIDEPTEIKPPEGFVLDNPDVKPSEVKPPEGFVLDSAPQERPDLPIKPPTVAGEFVKNLPGAYVDLLKSIKNVPESALAYEMGGAVKGATMGYVDPLPLLEQTDYAKAPIAKGAAVGAGQLIGMAAPITAIAKGVGMGMKSVEAFNTVRPWLRTLFQDAVAGGAFGRLKKGGNWQTAADDAALFMAFRGPFLALDRLMGKEIAVPTEKAGEIAGKALESYADTLYGGGGHGGVMQPGRGTGQPYKTVELPKGSNAKAEKAFWKTFIDEAQKAIEEMRANKGEPGLSPSAYPGQGSPTVLTGRVPTNFGITVRNLLKSIRHPSLTGRPAVWETEAVAGAAETTQAAKPAAEMSPQGSTYLKTEFPVLFEVIKATPQATPEIITAAVAAGIEAKLAGANGSQAETAAVKVLKEGAAALPKAPKPIEVKVDSPETFKEGLIKAFRLPEDQANSVTEMAKRASVQWAMATGRDPSEWFQSRFAAMIGGEAGPTARDMALAQEDLFAVQKESVNDRYKRYAEEGKAVGLEGSALHKYALERLARERQSQLPTERSKSKQMQFSGEGGVKAFGSDVPELFQDEGNVNRMAEDLAQSRDAQEIDQKLDLIFGTEAENAKIDAGEAPDNIQHRLAARFRADLEQAANEGDTAETARILNRMMEVARQAGKIEAPADAGERPTAKFAGYQEDGEGGFVPLFNVQGNHDLKGSTVSDVTLKLNGIQVPEIPSMEEWKKSETKGLTEKDVKDFAETLQQKHGVDELDLHLTRDGDIRLDTIALKKTGTGAGTKAMEEIVAFADKHQKRITLSLAEKGYQPIEGGPRTTSPDRLRSFYKRFGFVDNKGRNKDFRLSDSMYRRPDEGQLYQSAYHGSPHKFEKFSLQHIGSGEGAAAYGWGMYFAGNKEVADFYREKLAENKLSIGNDIIDPTEVEDSLIEKRTPAMLAVKALLDELEFWKGIEPLKAEKLVVKALNRLSNYRINAEGNAVLKDEVKLFSEAGQWLSENRGNVKINKTGRLYKVDIPEDDKYLDWDQPISKQSEPIQKAVKDILAYKVSYRDIGSGLTDVMVDGMSIGTYPTEKAKSIGENWPAHLPVEGQYIYNEIANRFDNGRLKAADYGLKEHASPKENASLLLSQKGVAGLKYMDQLSRQPGAKEKSFNYVVFDDKLVKILEFEQAQKGFAKGSIEFMEDGRAIIRAFESADVTTAIHEALGHVFRRDLYRRLNEYPKDKRAQIQSDIKAAEEWAGVKKGKWTREAEEKWARGFERYLATGKAPSYELQRYYDMYAEWFKQVYGSIKGTAIDIKLSPEIKAVFDRFFDDGMETLEDGRKVPKEEVRKHAQAIAERVMEERRMNKTPLDEFLESRSNHISGYEKGEMVDVKKKYRLGKKKGLADKFGGRPLDEVAADAKKQGLIPEGVDAEKYLLEYVTQMPKEGGLTWAFQFYDEALHEMSGALYQTAEPGKPPSGDISDENYVRNRELAEDKKDAIVRPMLQSAARQVEAMITPISHVLKNIDPSIRSALRRNAYNEGLRVMEDTNAVVPFLRGLKRLPNWHRADMDLALKNGDIKRVEWLVEKYGLTEEFTKARRMLNEVHRRAKEVGFDIGYLQDYWPRAVKDKEGFLAFVGKDPRWPDIAALLKVQEDIKGGSLSVDEKIAVINMYLRGYSNAMLSLPKSPNMKRRLIETVTPELNKFYYDSTAAMMNYIRTANHAIEARRFFGRGAKEMWKENLDESIGSYVLDLVEKGVIKKAGQDQRLKDALNAYFNQKGMHGFWAGVKDLSVATTMGSFISALTQLGDLGFSLYRAPFQTMSALAQAMVGRSNIQLKDLGLHDIASELADSRRSAMAVGKILEISLLPMFDKIMSETFINAVLKKYAVQAKKKSPALMERIRAAFGKDRPDVVSDLARGYISDDVKFLVFSELLGIQPKALTELPEVFLRGGNARIFYLLKTFQIRQLDFIREEVFDKLREPGLKSKAVALGRLIGIVTAMLAVGVTRDEIKDWVLRRKTTFGDHVIDNLWQLIGASKWMVYKARQEGLGSAVMKNILPPAPWIDYPTKDIRSMGDGKGFESVQLIPNIGKLYYWWFGRGANKKTGWRGAQKQGKGKGGISRPNVGVSRKGIKRPL